jgi:hypothetical protein
LLPADVGLVVGLQLAPPGPAARITFSSVRPPELESWSSFTVTFTNDTEPSLRRPSPKDESLLLMVTLVTVASSLWFSRAPPKLAALATRLVRDRVRTEPTSFMMPPP